MNRTEQKIEAMRQRISTGRTKEIILLEQLIELKAENAALREENAMKKREIDNTGDYIEPEKKPMSRIDVIARNGNDGQHYDEIGEAMPTLEGCCVMKYKKLRNMTKSELISVLIPMIERAVKINESWVEENEGVHPTDKEFDSMEATSASWADLRDLHDDYGSEP